MIELDLSNGASVKHDKVVDWSGVFVFEDDSPEDPRVPTLYLGQGKAMRTLNALKKAFDLVPIRADNPVFQRLLDKQQQEGVMLSADERILLDGFLHEASVGL